MLKNAKTVCIAGSRKTKCFEELAWDKYDENYKAYITKNLREFDRVMEIYFLQFKGFFFSHTSSTRIVRLINRLIYFTFRFLLLFVTTITYIILIFTDYLTSPYFSYLPEMIPNSFSSIVGTNRSITLFTKVFTN